MHIIILQKTKLHRDLYRRQSHFKLIFTHPPFLQNKYKLQKLFSELKERISTEKCTLLFCKKTKRHRNFCRSKSHFKLHFCKTNISFPTEIYHLSLERKKFSICRDIFRMAYFYFPPKRNFMKS